MGNEVKTSTISSTFGELEMNIETGEIVTPDTVLQDAYDIKKFDVAEWIEFNQKLSNPWNIEKGLDILEIGWYTTNGKYVPANPEYRNDMIENDCEENEDY